MLIKVIFSIIHRLPLKGHHFLGKFIGYLLFHFDNRNKHISKVNIELCFPNLSDSEKKRLLKKTLMENGKTLIECFWLWRHPKAVLSTLLGDITNKYLLTNVSQQASGSIFVTPHYGSWEFIGLLTAAHTDLLILYAPPKSEHVNQLSCQGRTSTGGKVISTETLNIKTLIKHIKSGGSLGILPDQVPEGNGGVYSKFFDRQCYTSTLVCRLASKLKCPVVFCHALREQGETIQYNAFYHEAPDEIYSDDIYVATDALNQYIENLIVQNPEQYIWGYKRFKRPAPGDSYPY